jgi:hypothetical protein
MPYTTMTPTEAVDRLQEFYPHAQSMVQSYIADNEAQHGEPTGGWTVDEYDIAEIERQYGGVGASRDDLAAAADAAHAAAESLSDDAFVYHPDEYTYDPVRGATAVDTAAVA